MLPRGEFGEVLEIAGGVEFDVGGELGPGVFEELEVAGEFLLAAFFSVRVVPVQGLAGCVGCVLVGTRVQVFDFALEGGDFSFQGSDFVE